MKKIFFTLFILVTVLACGISPTPQTSKPSVAIASPSTGIAYQVGQAVPLQAAVADTNGLSRIELRVDGQLLNTDNLNPPATSYTVNHSWTPEVPGSHIIDIRAYNVDGAVNEPVQVIFTVDGEGDKLAQVTSTPEILVTPTTVSTATPTAELTTTDPMTEPTTAAPDEATPVPTTESTTTPTAAPPSEATSAPTATPTPVPTSKPDTPTPFPTQPRPVIHSFTADPPTLTSGGKVVLSWDTSNAANIILQYGNRIERMGKSSYTVSPTTTSQYELIVSNQTAGETRATVTVTVLSPTPGPIDPAIPVVDLSADPPIVAVGDCMTVDWRVIGPAIDIRLFHEAVAPVDKMVYCPEEPKDSGFTIQAFGPSGVAARRDIEVKAVSILAEGTGVIPNSSSLDIDLDGGIDLYRVGKGVAAKVNEGPPADYGSLTPFACLNQTYHPDVPLGPYPNQATCLITSQNRVGKFQVLSVDEGGVMTIEYTVWDFAREDAPGYAGG